MFYKKRIWALEKLVRPRKSCELNPNRNVLWLSYHIPKTAGSSLRNSFETAFKCTQVFGAYSNSGAKELTNGLPVWTPSKCKVIHGHFKPQQSHLATFPNARRIVWVRDPIERIYSLVRHLLQLRDTHPQYAFLKENYIDNNVTCIDDIVYDIIVNNSSPIFTRAYARFFTHVPVSDLEFVGSVHNYDRDIIRLSQVMGVELKESFKNVRSNQQKIPNVKVLKPYLKEEYDIVAPYI